MTEAVLLPPLGRLPRVIKSPYLTQLLRDGSDVGVEYEPVDGNDVFSHFSTGDVGGYTSLNDPSTFPAPGSFLSCIPLGNHTYAVLSAFNSGWASLAGWRHHNSMEYRTGFLGSNRRRGTQGSTFGFAQIKSLRLSGDVETQATFDPRRGPSPLLDPAAADSSRGITNQLLLALNWRHDFPDRYYEQFGTKVGLTCTHSSKYAYYTVSGGEFDIGQTASLAASAQFKEYLIKTNLDPHPIVDGTCEVSVHNGTPVVLNGPYYSFVNIRINSFWRYVAVFCPRIEFAGHHKFRNWNNGAPIFINASYRQTGGRLRSIRVPIAGNRSVAANGATPVVIEMSSGIPALAPRPIYDDNLFRRADGTSEMDVFSGRGALGQLAGKSSLPYTNPELSEDLPLLPSTRRLR